MVKKLLFGALLFSGFAVGQITVTQYDLVGPTDIIEQAYDQNMSISHTAAGANQTWNYSALLEDSTGTMSFGAAGWGNGSAEFPDATLSANDNSGMGDIYLRKNSDALDLLGFYGDLSQSGNDEAYYFDPQNRITPLPLTYNTTDQNSFVFEFTVDGGQQADSVRIKQVTDQEFEADAWGELTTPLGTFDVVRLKKIEITTDSTWAYAFGNETLVNDGKDTTYMYNFWTNDQTARFPLVEYEYDPASQQIDGDITWLKAEPTTTIQTSEKATFSLFPNPAEDNLTVTSEAELSTYTVFDITGQKVLSGNTDTVNISELKNGVYLLKVITKDGHIGTKKFVKK